MPKLQELHDEEGFTEGGYGRWAMVLGPMVGESVKGVAIF